ncbi:MAG: tetratricopeptide repeat protein [Elusimicrobiaceae bacterium]|nr:tetratricopeptide repeat protein [Elusimicrobiaceae bacterium]
MKKFILGILIGIIIAFGAVMLLKQENGNTVQQESNNTLNKIRQQQNYQNDVQEKLREAVLNLSKAKEPEDIIKSLDEILKYRPQDANVHALKAQILQRQGNLPAAIEAINKAISIDPKNPNYYQMRAEMEFNAGDFDKAEQDFTAAAQLSGKADNYYNRAVTNLNLGNYQAANRDFQKARDLYKKEGNLGAAKQAGNISKMLIKNMPSQALQTTPTTKKPSVQNKNNIPINKKTMDKISNSLKHASESETLKDFKNYMPKNDDILSAFSGFSTQVPKPETPAPVQDEPIPTFKDIVEQKDIKAPKIKKQDLLKGTALQSIVKAHKMLANKDFEGARAVLDSAINNFPDNDSLYYHRAQANYQNGDYKSAFADLNKALDLNPNNYQAAISRGDLFNSLGQTEQAKKAYLDAANIAKQAGNNMAAEDAKTKYQLLEGKEISARTNQRFAEASNAFYKGDYDRAVNLFNQLYAENPDGPNAFNLGLAYQGQGNMKEANKMFMIAAEKQPRDLKTQTAAANSLAQSGDFDAAKKYLDKAMEIDNTNPDLWTISAQIDANNGDYAKTRQDFQNALQGYEQKLGEIEDQAERQRIEKQMQQINEYLEQMAQAGF